MEKSALLLVVLLAIIALVASNPAFRKDGRRDSCEISSYEYAKLQDAIDLNPEIANLAQRECKGDTITMADYNRIMRKVELVNLKAATKVAALQRVAANRQ